MNSLDRAVELILAWPASRRQERAETVVLLEAAVKNLQEATAVWQESLDAPGAAGDKYSFVSWVGPARAKRLHEICLSANAHVERLCALAGPRAGRFAALEEDLVEMAYRLLNEGETGLDAAKSAIERMGMRVAYLRGLAERIRMTPAQGGARTAPKKVAQKFVQKTPKKRTAAKKKAPKKK